MTTFFRGHSWRLLIIIFLSLVMTGFRVLEVLYIAFIFGHPLPLFSAFLIGTLPGLVLLLPIPGGIGLFETSNAAIFTLLGISIHPVAFTMIIRLRDFIFIVIGAVHALHRGVASFGKKKSPLVP